MNHVQGCSTEMAVEQFRQKSFFVNHRPARGVNHNATRLQFRQLFSADEILSFLRKWNMNTKDVRPDQYLSEGARFFHSFHPFVIRTIKCNDVHFEGQAVPGNHLSDATEPDDPKRSALQFSSKKPIALPFAAEDSLMRLRNVA